MNIHLLIICVISYCLAVMALYAQPVNQSSGFDALAHADRNHRNIGDEENDVRSGAARSESATNAPTAPIDVLFRHSLGMSYPRKNGSIGISLVPRQYAAWMISDGSYAAVTRNEDIKLVADVGRYNPVPIRLSELQPLTI